MAHLRTMPFFCLESPRRLCKREKSLSLRETEEPQNERAKLGLQREGGTERGGRERGVRDDGRRQEEIGTRGKTPPSRPRPSSHLPFATLYYRLSFSEFFPEVRSENTTKRPRRGEKKIRHRNPQCSWTTNSGGRRMTIEAFLSIYVPNVNFTWVDLPSSSSSLFLRQNLCKLLKPKPCPFAPRDLTTSRGAVNLARKPARRARKGDQTMTQENA